MTSSLQRRARVLRCVISTADHGAALNGEAVREATAALRQLGPEAGRVAAQLAEGPTVALIKRLVRDGASAEFGAQLDAEAEQIAVSASGAEGREGVRAFLERRQPRFHDESAATSASRE